MNLVKSVSYIFNINGKFSDVLQAKRGVRQGDPISPLLFVIMIEYLNRCMVKLQKNPNFNHHAKCEKLGLTNLTFADDILLFCRGDKTSVDLMLAVFNNFSDSTGLIINPRKCKVFFGSVDQNTRESIQNATGFEIGYLAVRYLGIPLSSKKLNLQHYLPLIDKITRRIHHWTAKLLSYAGRVQLIKSFICSIAQYWMLSFPLPKVVIKRIDAICRSFMWTSKADICKKSLVAWNRVCSPNHQGGLGLNNLHIWNQVTLLNCLWNICCKSDNLWI